MSILNINDKNFINCRSITDYQDKITSIYKDKCFLLLKQLNSDDFRYNAKGFEKINDFVLIAIKDITYYNGRYYYYPESIIYASKFNINLYDVFKTITGKSGLISNFEDSCYLELTKELVYELQ